MFQYNATITDVYDGDTVTADIDLGFKAHQKGVKLRLFGIDTPEVRGEERPEGLVSKKYLSDLILGKQVILKTYKDKTGKYGRWLAEIYLDAESKISVNQMLVKEGYAEEANY